MWGSFMLADQAGGIIHGAHFNRPGKIQTVTRGELFALVVLVRLIDPWQKSSLSQIITMFFAAFLEGQQHALIAPTGTSMLNYLQIYMIKH